jgi:hypothetical protein
MKLKVLPLTNDWALRRMLLCVRGQPETQSALGLILAHLEAQAAADDGDA